MSKSLSILVYTKRQKIGSDGKAPLYVRITIDGDQDDFSLSRKVFPAEWNQKRQICTAKSQDAKLLNAKIAQAKGDLTRLFQPQPADEMIKASRLVTLYFDMDVEKGEQKMKRDSEFHEKTISFLDKHIALVTKRKTALKQSVTSHLLEIIQAEQQVMIASIEQCIRESKTWLDDPAIEKSLMDAVYAFLLTFLFKVVKDIASHETLRKWISTKNTYQRFIKYRYKLADIPLKSIQLKLAEDLKDFLTLNQGIGNNAAMKYIKNLKQILDGAVIQGWMPSNSIESFKCTYTDPERPALTLDEIAAIINHDFQHERMREVRDVFIFCCFTGFAYQEVYKLRPNDVRKGIDGQQWVNTNRNKTKNPEFLPLLPIPEDIIAKYRSHPYCNRYRKLLPVNSNQRFNAYLKELGNICGIDIDLTTHTARHTFATTIALEHDFPLKIVSVMLGHKTVRTTEIYARASKQAISRHMNGLREKLFGRARCLLPS